MSHQKRRHWRLELLLFVLSAVVYGLTMAPGLTWEHRGADGGDFLAAAASLGVAHPPGYPTYTLLLHLLMQVPWTEPALAGNVLSALAGATAVALCGGILYQILEHIARGPFQWRWIPWAAAAGALSFGFFPLVWGQALITEVYTLHLLLVAAIFWLLLRWRRTGRGLPATGLLLGIGLTHHLTIAFVGPAALAILWSGRKQLKWRAVLSGGLLFLVGLLPYLYLPWAARRAPPVNWENPQTWENFQKLVFASRYRHNLFEPTLAEMGARVLGWLQDFPALYFWPVYLLVILGLLWLLRRDPAAGLMTVLFALGTAAYAVSYGTSDYWVNLLPALMMVAIWLGVGLWMLLSAVQRRWGRGRPWVRGAGRLLVVAIPLALLLTQWNAMDISDDHSAQDFVEQVLSATELDAVVFARGDGQIFALWYACYVRDERPDLTPILPTFLRSAWYRDILETHHHGLDLRPEGLGAEALDTMLQRHAGSRPIYLTWEEEELAGAYTLIKEGSLWRVQKPAAGLQP